jgi:predicted permease
MDHLIRDVSYGFRGLWRDRAFAVTTIATLGVALGLATAVFIIFNAYVLRPYAVRDPYSLHEIRWRSQNASGRLFRWGDYQELQSQQALFDGIIAERNRPVAFEARTIVAAFVSGNYFENLGARIHLGRQLAAFDATTPGSAPVAVLSHKTWTALFEGDVSVIGREIRLNNQVVTIVGVTAKEFIGINDTPPDLWMPVTMHGEIIRQDLFGTNQPRELALIGRLRAGVTAAQAEAALTPLIPRLVERTDSVRAEILPQATPASLSLEEIAVLSPVFASFVLVLLAASANVTNVMLARANVRQREIGIRLSVGASRGRVVRQLFTEGMLISVLAGIVGLALGSLVTRTGLNAFVLALPSAAAVTRIIPLDFDHRVFAFTFLVAGATTVLFALMPALHATRMTLTGALRGELSGSVRGATLRNFLVASQVAVSVVLLIGAATLVRNGLNIESTELGLRTAGVISVSQDAPGENLLAQAAELLRNEPRVSQVAVASGIPLHGQFPKVPLRATSDSPVVITSYMFVSPEYFPTVSVPILRGRPFSADEARSEAKVGILSASAARSLWPDEEPIGKTIQVWIAPEPRSDLMTRRELASTADVARQSETVTVIGIAGDVVSGLIYEGRDRSHLYLPTSAGAQHAKALLVGARSIQDLRPESLQALLQNIHPNPLAFDAMTLDDALAIQRFPLMVASWIGLVLSGVALILSVSGLYGVVTHSVSQRTREIGIRMALGASSAAVVRMLMTQSGRLVAVGGGVGLVFSLGVLSILRALLVKLDNLYLLDAAAVISSALLIGAAAAIATYYPARRASTIEPSEVLRAEG